MSNMKIETPGARRLSIWLGKRGRGSTTQLSTVLNVSRPLVSFWSTGRSRPSEQYRPALAMLTGIESEEWMTAKELADHDAALVAVQAFIDQGQPDPEPLTHASEPT